MLGKLLGLVALSVLSPRLWTPLRLLALSSHPTVFTCGLFPQGILQLLQPWALPAATTILIEFGLGHFLPDQWRTLRLWRRLLPIVALYMWTKARSDSSTDVNDETRQRRWDRRHDWGAVQVHRMISCMGGYYVKTAQVLASKTEFIPRQWCLKLAELWDSLKPRPWPQVQKSMQRTLLETPAAIQYQQRQRRRLRLDQAFEELCPEPLAAASIAQVHAVRLSPHMVRHLGPSWLHGPDAVAKVRHYDVQAMMGSDLRNLGRVARFLSHVLPFDIMPVVEEMREVIPKEFDFLREARMMRAIRSRLAAAGLLRHLSIPEPIFQLSAHGLIVMQRMHGTPLTAVLRAAANDPEVRQRAQAAVRHVVAALGHMMLVDGLFHADPHPGNIFLQDNGDAVLLDFGQCKALTADQQRQLCRMVLALSRGDTANAVDAARKQGLNFGGGRKRVSLVDVKAVHKMLLIMFDTRHMPEAIESPFGKDAVVAGAPLSSFPRDLYLILRAMLLLRGICHSLALDISAVDMWARWAAATLKLKPEVLQQRAAENRRIDLGADE